MFLVRTAFWLSLLLVVLPIDTGAEDSADQQSISAFQALGAAQSVISDLSQFCDRNEAACATGGAALEQVGHKARAGAKLVYEYLDGALDDNGTTASIPTAEPQPARNTLSAGDRDPEWRAPAAKPSTS